MHRPDTYKLINIDVLFENVNILIDSKRVLCDNQAINPM